MDMVKILFLDYRHIETIEGFTRKLEPPRKHPGNPILVSDHPVEMNHMSFYGSVVRRPDGLWQMWYTTDKDAKHTMALACVESKDGIEWHRPEYDVVSLGGKKTHLVFTEHAHGAAIIFDPIDPRADWRYKLLTGGAPSHKISAYRSPDGIHWQDADENPVIGINPDCPMSFHRARDQRYVLYCRPRFGDRRVSRRESWDFLHWSEPKIVIDQDPLDPPQIQFYGMGTIPYGAYELGTLWLYHTEVTDMGFNKMLGHQQPELAYSRSGYAWHRAEIGTPWIKLGEPGSWEWGNIQMASQPVLLKDEVRFYYVATRSGHGTLEYNAKEGARCGIGFASILPDRFVGVSATSGSLLTRPLWTDTPEFWANAIVRSGGSLRVELTDVSGKAIPGFDMASCVPISGDSTMHKLAWSGNPSPAALLNTEIRMRVAASNATLYALMAGTREQVAAYWQFRTPAFVTIQQLKDHGLWSGHPMTYATS